MTTAPLQARRRLFANPEHVVQSWYVVSRSRALRRGRVNTVDLGTRRIAYFRDDAGAVHAVDARCPHLGADLGEGRVEGAELVCAFHGWRIGASGAACGRSGEPCGRRVRSYPVTERYGLVWLFNGPEPRFALPPCPLDGAEHAFLLPIQTLRCHPHLVVGNGVDVEHVSTLHGFDSLEPAVLRRHPEGVSVEIRVRARSAALRAVLGSSVRARFAAIGGSMAWATFPAPLDFAVLFTGRPDPAGRCVTQTAVLARRWTPLRLVRGAVTLWALLRDDRRILESLDFAPAFTPADAPLAGLAEVIDQMETW